MLLFNLKKNNDKIHLNIKFRLLKFDLSHRQLRESNL